MTEKVLQLGRPVLMAGFPAASDQVFPRQPAGQPMITAGTICCYDRDFELAAATYQGGRSSATAPLNSWDPLHRILSPSCREQCSSLVAHTHMSSGMQLALLLQDTLRLPKSVLVLQQHILW